MSFQRRATSSRLSGTRQGGSGQTVVSWGVAQLDHILGGGVVLGSCTLLAEDANSVYSRQLVKAFVAEGIVEEQRVLVVQGDWPVNLEELPRSVASQKEVNNPGAMKIAFRYERLPEHQSLPESNAGHVLDFGLCIDPDQLKNADVKMCSLLEESQEDILKTIAASISKEKVLRVVVTLGTCLVQESGSFLQSLKVLSRHENVVCLASVPQCCPDDLYHRLFSLADCALSLTAFSSDERKTNPLFQKYHGLLNLEKLAKMNSITSFKPPTLEYTFHQTGKRFQIEQLHMPPDFGEAPAVTMSCQTSGGGRPLDF